MPGYDPKRDRGENFPVKRWPMSAKRLDSMARTAFRLGQHYANPAAESRMDAPRSERVQSPAIDAIVSRHIPDHGRKTHFEVMPEQARAIVEAAWRHGIAQHHQQPKKAASDGGPMKKLSAVKWQHNEGSNLAAQGLAPS